MIRIETSGLALQLLFAASYGEHAVEAFAMGASGYIVKSPDPERILLELSRLRDPVRPAGENQMLWLSFLE